MRYSRREFMWTMGAAAAAYGFHQGTGVFWAPEPQANPGWTPGIEDHPASACLICPSRCGIRGRVIDGRLVAIDGNRLHPLNRGGLCPRGVAGVQVLYHPRRLKGPVARVGPRGASHWRAVSKDGAISLLSDRLRAWRAQGRPEATALLAGYCAGSMKDLLRRFMESYGSPGYVADEYEDGLRHVMEQMHGIARRPGYDLERASHVLSFGAPLFESWWSPLQAHVAFSGRGRDDGVRPRFVQVDTRFSRTAAWANEWVGIQPGTYGILALGIAYVLIRDGLFDADFVDEHVIGFEDFLDDDGRERQGFRSLVMARFRTEEVSAATGVPVDRITNLARAFAGNQPAVAVCGTDVTLGPEGFGSAVAVHALNVLAGSVNRPGGVLFGKDPPLAPLSPIVLDETANSGLALPHLAGEDPSIGDGDMAARFARAAANGDSDVQTLMVYYADPLGSSGHWDLWRAALARIPFVVCFSPFLDETSAHADLIIPDLLPYERWQDAPTPESYPYPVWGLSRPLVDARTDGVNTGDVVLELARRLGGSVAESLPYESFEALLRARSRGLHEARRGLVLADEFERRHHGQMEQRGWWLPEYADFESFWDGLVERGGWMDPFYDDTDPDRLARTMSGRIRLLPPDPLRPEEPPTSAGGTEAETVNYFQFRGHEVTPPLEFPLRLIPYRVSTLSSGTMALARWAVEVPTVFPEVFWHPWVEVNPNTAARLGLDDGAQVWVVSPRGRIRVTAKVFSGTARDTVCIPYRLADPEGEPSNPLRLLDGGEDPRTGLPIWTATFVRLERA